jgi:hypothetical protein
MKMVNMANTASELKAQDKPLEAGASPQYPYGLQISLRHHDLAKLGVGQLPKVGSKVHIHGHGVVTQVSHEERQSGPPNRHVQIQLHKMGMEQGGGEPGSAREAVDNALDSADA